MAAAGLVPADHRGLGFGLLGGVNGAGDLVSSQPWSACCGRCTRRWAFGYAAALMGLGAAAMLASG